MTINKVAGKDNWWRVGINYVVRNSEGYYELHSTLARSQGASESTRLGTWKSLSEAASFA